MSPILGINSSHKIQEYIVLLMDSESEQKQETTKAMREETLEEPLKQVEDNLKSKVEEEEIDHKSEDNVLAEGLVEGNNELGNIENVV